MGTSANIQTRAQEDAALQGKRRRIYAAITAVVAVIAAVAIWLAVGPVLGPLPSFTISLSRGSVATGAASSSATRAAEDDPGAHPLDPLHGGVTRWPR